MNKPFLCKFCGKLIRKGFGNARKYHKPCAQKALKKYRLTYSRRKRAGRYVGLNDDESLGWTTL